VNHTENRRVAEAEETFWTYATFASSGTPDLGRAPALGLVGFAAQPTSVFEDAEGAVDFAAFLVAAVLFQDLFCGWLRRRPTMTGANGQVVAFSGT
jgi:hypothetical protein